MITAFQLYINFWRQVVNASFHGSKNSINYHSIPNHQMQKKTETKKMCLNIDDLTAF